MLNPVINVNSVVLNIGDQQEKINSELNGHEISLLISSNQLQADKVKMFSKKPLSKELPFNEDYLNKKHMHLVVLVKKNFLFFS